MIQFIKIAPYPLVPQDGTDTYDYLCGITNQTIDPPSLEPNSIAVIADSVLYSPLQRSAMCLRREPHIEYQEFSALREVPFDLPSICPRSVWELERSIGVRRGFCEAFVQDRLLIPRQQLIDEVREVLHIVSAEAKQREVAVVSHSFRLKLLEAFIFSDGALASDPSLLSSYIQAGSKTYDFGTGFAVSLDRIGPVAE